MDLPFADVSLVAVVVSTILNMVSGMIWYSPGVFGTRWIKLSGVKNADTKEGMQRALTIAIISSLIGTYAIGLLMVIAFPGSPMQAITFGILLLLGTTMPVYVSESAWEMRPTELLIINFGWSVVSVLLTVLVFQLLPF